jgi:hypothetical protein
MHQRRLCLQDLLAAAAFAGVTFAAWRCLRGVQGQEVIDGWPAVALLVCPLLVTVAGGASLGCLVAGSRHWWHGSLAAFVAVFFWTLACGLGLFR